MTELGKWIDGSAFVDNGSPRVWYHGTDGDVEFNVFARYDEASLGFHFGPAEVASDRLEQIYRMAPPEEREGRIIPVYCRAINPLRLADHFCWRLDRVAGELFDRGLIDERTEESVVEGYDPATLFAAIENAGYDAVVYENRCEFEARPSDCLMIWRPELVKGVFASEFRRDDPSILPQAGLSPAERREWLRSTAELDEAKAALLAARAPAFG